MIKRLTIYLGILIFLVLPVYPAWSQLASNSDTVASQPLTAPVPATYENVLKAAVRFGAFDLNDDNFIDNFAKILHCDIYEKYHPNEFDWRRVRAALRKSIQLEMPTYPTVLYLERGEQFTTYDFGAGVLNLASSSVMRRTSNLEFARVINANTCMGDPIESLPSLFTGTLDNPIQIDGIELTEDQAKDVVAGLKMEEVNDENNHKENVRIAYGRYLIQLTGIGHSSSKDTVAFTAHLINITFYEDAAFQIPFWRGGSTVRSSVDRQNNTLQAIPFKGIDESQQ